MHARACRTIGPVDYLAGTTPLECRDADRIGGLLHGLDPSDPAAAAWKTFAAASTARANPPAERIRTIAPDRPGTFAFWHRWPVSLLRWEWATGGFATRALAETAAGAYEAEGDDLVATARQVPTPEQTPDFTTPGTTG